MSYNDKNQFISDVPWSVTYPGDDDGDNLLENNEKAEITVWLLNRITATAIGSNGSVSTTTAAISVGSQVLTANDQFTIEVKPPQGAVLNAQRTLPAALDTVMDLN